MKPDDLLTLGYIQAHPLEAARRVEAMDAKEVAALFSPLPPTDLASVLEHCMPSAASKIISLLPQESGNNVLTALTASSAIGVLRQFDDPLRKEFLARLGKVVGASLRRAMRYPSQTAGSLADPRVFTLPPDISVHEAREWIIRDRRNTRYYVYVIDRDTKLEGLVTLKQLLVSDDDHLIATIMNNQVMTLPAEATIKEILQHPQWIRFPTLPVVDQWGTFLGALGYQTLRGIEQEVTGHGIPGPVSQTLIQLWEAYSLAGINILTDMADAMKNVPAADPSSSCLTQATQGKDS